MDNDAHLFEKICLEGLQAGLSWRTILNKRDAFRIALANFDLDRVAGFDNYDVKRLLLNAGIVRHAGKIASSINNAQRAQELRTEFGSLGRYFWQFEPGADSRPVAVTYRALTGITTSPESIAMSKDLKKGDGVSSGLQRCTPSCNRWDWSTTTSRDAMRE